LVSTGTGIFVGGRSSFLIWELPPTFVSLGFSCRRTSSELPTLDVAMSKRLGCRDTDGLELGLLILDSNILSGSGLAVGDRLDIKSLSLLNVLLRLSGWYIAFAFAMKLFFFFDNPSSSNCLAICLTLDSESIDISDDERSTGEGEIGRFGSVIGSGMRRDLGGSGVDALGGVGTRNCGVGARSGSVTRRGVGARSGSAEDGDSTGAGAGGRGGRGVGSAGFEGFVGIDCFSTT
jgi:hypothetical protein